jgi:hypothetical protein
MKIFEPTGSSMYNALQDFYPLVTPSMEFVSNLYKAFEAEIDLHNGILTDPNWGARLAKWLPDNTGLIRDPADENWVKFRVVDEKLYTLALLKYS